jgi:hypothetical protein
MVEGRNSRGPWSLTRAANYQGSRRQGPSHTNCCCYERRFVSYPSRCRGGIRNSARSNNKLYSQWPSSARSISQMRDAERMTNSLVMARLAARSRGERRNLSWRSELPCATEARATSARHRRASVCIATACQQILMTRRLRQRSRSLAAHSARLGIHKASLRRPAHVVRGSGRLGRQPRTHQVGANKNSAYQTPSPRRLTPPQSR